MEQIQHVLGPHKFQLEELTQRHVAQPVAGEKNTPIFSMKVIYKKIYVLLSSNTGRSPGPNQLCRSRAARTRGVR